MMETGESPEKQPTLASYVEAIGKTAYGRFLTRFAVDFQWRLAELFMAPLFALQEHASDVLRINPAARIQLYSTVPALADFGGRGLALYARLLNLVGRERLMICVSAPPLHRKAPRGLLTQLPQKIEVMPCVQHLKRMSQAPEIIVMHGHPIGTLYEVAQLLPELAAGSRLVLMADSRASALVIRHLFVSCGYRCGSPVNFQRDDGQPRHAGVGVFSFAATVPVPADLGSVNEVARMQMHWASGAEAFTTELLEGVQPDQELTSQLIATRSVEKVEGESIAAMRLSSHLGMELASGRLFRFPTDDVDEKEIRWLGDSEVIELPVPPPDERGCEDDDRTALLLWLGEIMHRTSLKDDEDAGSGSADDPQSGDGPVAEEPSAAVSEDPELVAEAENHGDPVPRLEAAPDDSPVGSAIQSDIPPSLRLPRGPGTVDVAAIAAMLGRPREEPGKVFERARGRIIRWLADKGFTGMDASGPCHIEQPEGELTIETDGARVWAMRYDDRRQMASGSIWRVEAALLAGSSSAIGLRLFQVRSHEDAPPPSNSGIPTVVVALANEIGLRDGGKPLLGSVLELKGKPAAEMLVKLLLDPDRVQPVILISGPVDASAQRLARRLTGMAHVASIDPEVSAHLTVTFGPALSIEGNAVRLYRPGFSANADAYQHRSWPRRGLQLPRQLADEIFEETCTISVELVDLEERVPSFQSVRSQLAEHVLHESERRFEAMRQQVRSLTSNRDEQISQLNAMQAELEERLAIYRNQAVSLEAELKDLQGELQHVRRERDSAREEARQLRYRFQNQWTAVEQDGAAEESQDVPFPDTWDELEAWVEQYGQDRLVLHPRAARAARDSPFKDVPLAYRAMHWLVQHYVPMRTRSDGDDAVYQCARHALAELGLEESEVGTADDARPYRHEYERQYDGRKVTLNRHLKRGVGFSAENTFRLYFHYDDTNARVLIGHLPTHLTNRLTHSG